MELAILYLTEEDVYTGEAVFTVNREPKSDSTLNKEADCRNRERVLTRRVVPAPHGGLVW
jgi:hypothetical protein